MASELTDEIEQIVDGKLRRMIISFGVKLDEKEKNPHLSGEELDRTVKLKVSEWEDAAGTEKGLTQADIDELLARI